MLGLSPRQPPRHGSNRPGFLFVFSGCPRLATQDWQRYIHKLWLLLYE